MLTRDVKPVLVPRSARTSTLRACRAPDRRRFRRLVAEALEPRVLLTTSADWEFFDLVTAPALPGGWSQSASTGSGWVTVNNSGTSDSGNQHAFVDDQAATSDKWLISSPVYAPITNAQLSFRNRYDTQQDYDGGVLEISIAGNPYNDILAAGGSFAAGGYNSTLNSGSTNPLAGRAAWSGDSGGYVTSVVNLPAAAAGQSVRFRWRMGTNSTVADVGWRIDSIRLLGGDAPLGEVPVVDLANGGEQTRISGATAGDQVSADYSVAVGDLNADGVRDLILGAAWADGPGESRSDAGEVYVYFGGGRLAGTKDIAGLAGTAPDVTIYGATGGDSLGFDHALTVGDVTGDGIDDLILGAHYADGPADGRSNAGEVYVIFGRAGLPATIDLAGSGEDVTIYGATAGDDLTSTGELTVGDVTGDGIDDLILIARFADGPSNGRSNAGEVYIIFGRAGLPATIDLASSGEDVTIYGATAGDSLASGAMTVGDVTGDGIDDLILGAYQADGPGELRGTAGEAYIIFGRAGLPATIDLASSGEDVTIYGATASDRLTEWCPPTVGDVTGDGIDDLILGAFQADGPGNARGNAGEAYIIFGRAGLPATIDLASSGEDVTIYGATADDRLTQYRTLTAADVTGDGIDDLVLGAYRADGPAEGRSYAGEAYIIFGRVGLPETIDLASSGEDVTIYGATSLDTLTWGGALTVGDVSGDGINDLILGADGADGPAEARGYAGEAYIIFGRAGLPPTIDLASSGEDVTIYGATADDKNSSRYKPLTVGDVTGDGIDDLILGAPNADGPADGRDSAGEVYILFGSNPNPLVTLATGDGADEVRLRLSGGNVEVYDDLAAAVLAAFPLAYTDSLAIQGSNTEPDRVTVDYAFGGFFSLPGGLTFRAGDGTGDRLDILGTGTTLVTLSTVNGPLADGQMLTSEGAGSTNLVKYTAFETIVPAALGGMALAGPVQIGSRVLEVDAAASIDLGPLTTIAGGALSNAGGLHLQASEVISGYGTISGPVSSDVGSTITLTGTATLGDAASFDGVNLAGRLNIGANTVTLNDGHKAVLGSQTTLGSGGSSGTVLAPNGIELPDTRTFVGQGTVGVAGNPTNAEFENQGFVQGNGSGITFHQRVTGAGDFGGTCTFLGGTDFGHSPAEIDVLGSATFGATNTHFVEIGGLEPGDEYDQVAATGVVALDGELQVRFINLGNGYLPQAADRFEIISSSGGVMGTFATETLPALPAGLRWDVQYHPYDVTLVVLPATLIVTGFTATPSGFVAQFSSELQLAGLNLYDGAGGTLGPADVILKDVGGQTVAGSVVVADNRHAVEFVKAGETLAAGTYSVTLKSGVNAFRDVDDALLDGNRDGTTGDDYTASFVVLSSSDRVVSVPDFARGAGQPVNIPNPLAGLPIRLDNADGVTSLAVDLVYAQDLLDITAATLAAGIPADWSVVNPPDTNTPGVAKIRASGTTPLSGTNVDVVRLTAAVPSGAPYGAVQAMRLENVSLNGGSIAAVGDVAVHKAVYLGDADGSGIHSSADAFLTVQAALGSASGFAAHAWTDPRIVGDADASGVLSAADAFLIVQEGVGLAEPFVPDNPLITVTPVGGGVDPQFQIGENLPADPGGSVTVPVRLDIEPAANNVGGIDFNLFFDPSKLTIAVPGGVSAGADTASGWRRFATLVAAGHLRVGLLSLTGLPLATGLRQIAQLQFLVDISAADSTVGLDIEPLDPAAGEYTWTASDGSLRVAPLPNIWHNEANPLDVDGDGEVTANDVLVGINWLNSEASDHGLPALQVDPPRYYDVNNDRNCTALDLLITINYLNQQSQPPGEGERGGLAGTAFSTVRLKKSPDEQPWLMVAGEGDFQDPRRDAVIRRGSTPAATEADLLESVLADLVYDLASAWRCSCTDAGHG